MNKLIKSYLKDVSSKLTCPRSVRSVFISELKNEIEDLIKEKRDLTYEMLCERYGSPDEIANGFYDRSDYSRLLQKAKKKAKRWKILCIIAVILLALAIGYLVYASIVLVSYSGTFNVSNPNITL